jgi:hypothetical protein
MSQPTKEIQSLSFIFGGSFNAQIFSPFWFSSESLIPKIEAEKASVEIVHPQASSFSTDWFKLVVTNNSFSIETYKDSHFESLRDLVIGTFQILRHTPIGSLGIQRVLHFRMSSLEEWNAFGNKIAPKELWKGLNDPGLAQLTLQSKRSDAYKGCIMTTIQPSARIKPGIFISIIDHFETSDQNKGTDESIKIIQSVWDDNGKQADTILSNMWG